MSRSKDTGGDVFLRAFFIVTLLISGKVIHSSITDDGSLQENNIGNIFEKLNLTRTHKN